ncbi:hypothetical protein SAMN04488107_0040 [Geodermatophilus saharensis]|uniref:DUF91 domain-containing protein n=1 Tax=Geodermatophilus saharensis TaxID=1137994 RepID=A0A238ZEW4_9ACTN|nr:hypothetical protein [Geodermatophilus saharensis]SNR82035.1 hypothetical protein SAMN04488107_0040 [Geodermatophilus saharensis]
MTNPAIFLQLDGRLEPLIETSYENEPLLQQLLQDFPDLIAGVATTGEGGRLLLVQREMPVPGPSGALGLSLDHLFVDHAGVPVFVEVKRASDTRARREVVAQMLDYAANGSTQWTADRLRGAAETTAEAADAAELLHDRLGIDDDPDGFWRTVEDNLRQGRMRLIFLADRIHPELISIIEFLNAQMRDTEVLGIELPQFTGAGAGTAYVPRVVGRTAVAAATKGAYRAKSGPRWTEETLLAAAEAERSPEEVAFLRRLIQHVRDYHGHFYWGTGTAAGLTGYYIIAGVDTPVWNFNLLKRGTMYFPLRDFRSRHTEERTAQFARAIAGLDRARADVDRVRDKDWKGWASLPLADATAAQDAVVAVLDHVLDAPQTAALP